MAHNRLVLRRPRLPNMVQKIQSYLPEGSDAWLVGGWVRDDLIGRASVDLDLVVAGPARRAARAVANGLGAAYYDLDRQRDTGRVLVAAGTDARLTLDFSHLDSDGIESDLRKRDFSVNALAMDLKDPTNVIDATGGLQDLEHGILRACGPTAIEADPIRALRAVRLAHQLGFGVEPGTLAQIRAASAQLGTTSAERIRDELFRILVLPSAGEALRQSNELDLLFQVLPELSPLQGQTQPAPHQFDVLEHSLRVADRLAAWVWATDANAHVWRELEPYSARIQAHLHQVLTLDRSRAALLVLAGLLHDMGKPAVAQTSEAGVVRFHGHESVGAEMAMRRAEGLHLSRSEVDSLGRIVANHMRPGQLAKETSLSGRAVYRFYRATGEEGVDICLLAMADLVGQSGAGPDDTRWEARLRVVRRLLEAYFDRRDQEVVPTPLVSGKELMLELNLKQGPQVGRLLEAIRQEQAEGTIGSREQALAFAARHTLDADVADGE